MDNRIFDEALPIWHEFIEQITYQNRYFPQCKFIEYLNDIIDNNKIVVQQDMILFRARLYKENDDLSVSSALKMVFDAKNGFRGYDERECGAPSCQIATAGRANPENISYLYTADNEYTAISEIRPFIDSEINIAKYKVLQDLNIVDFSVFKKIADIESIIEGLYTIVNHYFSIPVNRNDKKKYIATQYIAEYVKNKGFDGIKYKSSLSRIGNNITLFDMDKATAIGSEVFKLDGVNYYGTVIRPDEGRKIGFSHSLMLPIR